MSEPSNVNQPPKSWLSWVLEPGIGNQVINFSRLCIIALLIFLSLMSIFSYSIHYVIMSFLTLGLGASFEFFIKELRKSPEIMNPTENKPKNDYFFLYVIICKSVGLKILKLRIYKILEKLNILR